jgi:hypothetical protein
MATNKANAHRKRRTHKRKSRASKPKPSRRRSTKREEEARLDALAALALMRREGLSAHSAAQAEGTTVRNMLKQVRPALRKQGKNYFAKPSDRLTRPPMSVLDRKGMRPVVVRSSKAASMIGRYFNAVDDALKGKPAGLREFRGKKVPYNKLKFLTDLKTLRRLQDAGVLDNLKDIYWHGRKR